MYVNVKIEEPCLFNYLLAIICSLADERAKGLAISYAINIAINISPISVHIT